MINKQFIQDKKMIEIIILRKNITKSEKLYTSGMDITHLISKDYFRLAKCRLRKFHVYRKSGNIRQEDNQCLFTLHFTLLNHTILDHFNNLNQLFFFSYMTIGRVRQTTYQYTIQILVFFVIYKCFSQSFSYKTYKQVFLVSEKAFALLMSFCC